MANIVYIATSLDGYIADKNNSVDWLHSIENPTANDMGYSAHINNIDALVMGRNTLELVVSFGGEWPYNKPVFVLSNTLTAAPKGYEDKVFIVHGKLKALIADLNQQGYNNLYIDGGKTIQSFLKEDLIDEMVITTIPLLLGGGIPLFGELAQPLQFTCIKSTQLIDTVAQSHFVRKR